MPGFTGVSGVRFLSCWVHLDGGLGGPCGGVPLRVHTMIIVLFTEGEHPMDRAVDAVDIWMVVTFWLNC